MRKHNTTYGILGLVIGIIGGIAGTAFSLGADKQRINGVLSRHTADIKNFKIDDERHEKTVKKELDVFSEKIADQIVKLQNDIKNLVDVVVDLRIDVQVLKSIMERIDTNSLKTSS